MALGFLAPGFLAAALPVLRDGFFAAEVLVVFDGFADDFEEDFAAGFGAARVDALPGAVFEAALAAVFDAGRGFAAAVFPERPAAFFGFS